MDDRKQKQQLKLSAIPEETKATTTESDNHSLPYEKTAAAAVASANKKNTNGDEHDDDDDDDNINDNSPLWSRNEDDGWELTWPIWHMLPRHERRDIAHRNGYKTIGEFEEYMSLQQAYDDSNDTNNSNNSKNNHNMARSSSMSSIRMQQSLLQLQQKQKPYPNELIYPTDGDKKMKSKITDGTQQVREGENGDYGVDDDDDESVDDENTGSDNKKADYVRMASSGSAEDLSPDDLMDIAGKILILHDEILHQVFAFLPVDTYATLALVSPHWKHLTRTESVYKRLCERLYLNQSKKRQLHVSRFGGSYRTMLEKRPRVRAAGGCYVLKYSHIKKIQRDMWTEVPVGAILECVYYRYLYFQEDGRVLYALSSSPPHEMFKRLLKVCLRRTEDPAAVWGAYQVQKNALRITAKQEWHTVKFDLTIDTLSPHGRYGTLTLDRHLSSPSGCFEYWSSDLVEYDVPEPKFQFLRDRRL